MVSDGKMSPEDLKVCRAILAGLVSKERSKINFLFLEPVEFSYFPDYLTIIQRPMDLRTLGENLESGLYSDRAEFYSDAQLIFDNAVLFNKGRSDSSWVVGLAKKMAKAFKREREKAETRELGAAISEDISVISKSKNSVAVAETAKPEKKKKIKLKLKRNSSAGELANIDVLAPSSSGSVEKDLAKHTGDAREEKSKPQLKFKLKVSKKSKEGVEKLEGEANESNAVATEARKVDPPMKKKLKLKISRGKELPKGVSVEDNAVINPSSNSTKLPREDEDRSSKEKIVEKQSKEKVDKEGNKTSRGEPEKSSKLDDSEKVSKNSVTKTSPSNSTSTVTDITTMATANFAGALMNAARRAQCYKVISSLKRRQHANCKWFLKPVSDPKIVKDYKEKISHPMDLSTLSSKLDRNQYETLAHFVLDLRRIFSNCLQYNTDYGDDFRSAAVECFGCAEDLLNFFVAKHESPTVVYPNLLYCWEKCINAIDSLLKVKNADDGHQTAWYFLQPVTFFCSGSYPEGYLEKVNKPIDLGTITQKLMLGCYNSVGAFVADCRTVVKNCKAYYADRDDGELFVKTAERLEESMEIHLGELVMFDRSPDGNEAKQKAKYKCMTIDKPSKSFLEEIMRDLRATTYTDRVAKITESATQYFEKPVDTTLVPDYLQIVENPMNLEAIDRKIENGSYKTPEDFEYDVNLIFKNCERYNQPNGNTHMISIGKHTAKAFRKLFSSKMKTLERGSFVARAPLLPTASNRDLAGGKKKRPLSPGPEERQAKRASTTDSSKSSIKTASRTASKAASAGRAASKSVGKIGSKKASSVKKAAPEPKPTQSEHNVAVPMHVAIASIKERYPGRRGLKELENWENDCVRFLKQLTKHPWITVDRPKYIFHVPVEFMFPEIKDSYSEKIEKPMDLTTAESKLLQGASYENVEEFVNDIALIFTNAISFNQTGHDIGEPTSCAYYEVSTHLLKYSRWLSLEVLQTHLIDSPSSPVVEKGSASTWKMTIQNREMARKEMENIVFNENIEKRYDPREKFTWTEQECDKLLKSLRHTSDYKHMSYFIQELFPADYYAYIKKPMAWEKCKKKFDDGKYDTLGDIVEDLRLIFSNALKYNAKARELSDVSRAAYSSAIHMSRKLEAAIDKMLLSVADRIGREKIDLITSQREMEAIRREEEEQMKLQWEKEHPSKVEIKTTIKVIHPRGSRRQKPTDFEFPFYDEEDDREDLQDDTLRHAKSLFEKQIKARAAMKEISLAVGIHVYRKLDQRAAARAWTYRMAYTAFVERKRKDEKLKAFKKNSREESSCKQTSVCVSTALNDTNRKQIKICLQKKKASKRKLLTSL